MEKKDRTHNGVKLISRDAIIPPLFFFFFFLSYLGVRQKVRQVVFRSRKDEEMKSLVLTEKLMKFLKLFLLGVLSSSPS